MEKRVADGELMLLLVWKRLGGIIRICNPRIYVLVVMPKKEMNT